MKNHYRLPTHPSNEVSMVQRPKNSGLQARDFYQRVVKEELSSWVQLIERECARSQTKELIKKHPKINNRKRLIMAAKYVIEIASLQKIGNYFLCEPYVSSGRAEITRLNTWRNMSNTRDSTLSGHPNTERSVENTTHSWVFLTKFELFG